MAPSKAGTLASFLFQHILGVWVIDIALRSDESVFHLPRFDK